MDFEYVTVPVGKCTANLDAPAENYEDHHKIKHKEYESNNPRRTMIEKRFSAGWP